MNVRGLIAQLVRSSHRYCEITGLNPGKVLNFIRLLYAVAKIASIAARIIALLDCLIFEEFYDAMNGLFEATAFVVWMSYLIL